MKSQFRNREHSWLWSGFVVAITALMFASVALANESDEPRTSATSQGKNIKRGEISPGASYDELDPLVTTGTRDKSTRVAGQQKTGEFRSPNTDFWFYATDVELFSDHDRDGYFYGIDLVFDADTVYNVADVYAVIYLSLENGPWNEYTETEDFTIFGASGDDEYAVETELVSGYPTGSYDVLIELYDTYDGSFVASIGPEESPELSFLPLEDAGRDAPDNTQIVVSSGGGGSIGWLMLASLAAIAGLSRRRS